MTLTEYILTQSSDLSFWQSQLTAPGNTGAIASWDLSDSLLAKAQLTNRGPSPKASKRWKRAQQAEAAFWKSWRENTLYSHISLEAFWQEVVEKTGGSFPIGKVLDIGCGPVSVLNFHRPEGMQAIGLDPLAAVYANANLIESTDHLEPIPIIGLPAEALPFPNAHLDHLICFNVLDHVANAPAVLDEMNRVLKPGGTIRLYVHTFQSWIKRFLFFDRPHVYHWDHPEFRQLLEKAGFEVEYELKEPKTFDFPKGLFSKLRHLPYWVATKVGYTSYFKVRKPKT